MIEPSTFKTETYRHLNLTHPTAEERAAGAVMPPGSVHLPDWIDEEWLKHPTAEQLVTRRNRNGFAMLEWQKTRERNEALDCRIYARAAAWIAGLDRWDDHRWQIAADDLAVAGSPDGNGKAPRRRSIADQLA